MNVKAVIPALEAPVGLVEVTEVDLIGVEARMEAVEAPTAEVSDLNVEVAIEVLEILAMTATMIGLTAMQT